jgi:rhodanese-related sulfurtransferase
MKSVAKVTIAALGCIGVASLVLWWLADHRRGIAWAVSVVRDRFPDVSQLSTSSLDAWLRDAQRPAPQLVDARSEEEFVVSHLPGALRASRALRSRSESSRGRLLFCGLSRLDAGPSPPERRPARRVESGRWHLRLGQRGLSARMRRTSRAARPSLLPRILPVTEAAKKLIIRHLTLIPPPPR